MKRRAKHGSYRGYNNLLASARHMDVVSPCDGLGDAVSRMPWHVPDPRAAERALGLDRPKTAFV